MCVWNSIAYSCGHHETRTEMCRVKMAARDTGFIHSAQCQLMDAYVEQSRFCPGCLTRLRAAVSYGKQQPHVLGEDPRDTLPSQLRKSRSPSTQDNKLHHPAPATTITSILSKKRKHKLWHGSTKATALEIARLQSMGIDPFTSTIPPDGRVIDDEGQVWLTAAAHQKEHQAINPRNEATQNHKPRQAQAAEPGQQSNSSRRGKQTHAQPKTSNAVQKSSVSTQQETELFLNIKEQEKVTPSCLILGLPNSPSQKLSFSQLSAEFEAEKTARQDYAAQNITGRAPTQSKVAKSSPINTVGTLEVSDGAKEQAAAPTNATSVVTVSTTKPAVDAYKIPLFPPRLPDSKRTSPSALRGHYS